MATWFIVGIETLTFGPMFVVFSVARLREPTVPHAGQVTLDLQLGALNTAPRLSGGWCAAHPDLARHHAIGSAIDGQGRVGWNVPHHKAVRPLAERLTVNTNRTQVRAALVGQRIARALAYQVTDEVRDGRLKLLLTGHEPPTVPVHLVYPAGRTGRTARAGRGCPSGSLTSTCSTEGA